MKKDKDFVVPEFRVPATDTKGHSCRQYFSCSPATERMVLEIVQSKKLPFKSKGDLFRWTLIYGLRYLKDECPETTTVWGQVEAILSIMVDDEFQRDFTFVFQKMDMNISTHIQSGDMGEAVRLIKTVRQHIEKMPDGFWKTKYLKQLEVQYGETLKNAKILAELKLSTIEKKEKISDATKSGAAC